MFSGTPDWNNIFQLPSGPFWSQGVIQRSWWDTAVTKVMNAEGGARSSVFSLLQVQRVLGKPLLKAWLFLRLALATELRTWFSCGIFSEGFECLV